MRQIFRYLTVAAMGFFAAGCAQQDVNPVDESTITVIRYQVGPCHGMCPVYSVDLQEDGTTRFTGEQFTAVEGERTIANDSESFALVRQRLSAWQPAMGTTVETTETPKCGPRATDLSHYTMTWTRGDGEKAVLEHDSGCRSDEARQLTEFLQSLPGTLGIQSWVQR